MRGQKLAQRRDIQRRAAVDRGAHLFAQAFVGHGVDRRLLHVGVHQQRGLDLSAADVLAAADDQVLDAVDDGEETLFVDRGHVAGAEPVADKGLGVGLGSVPVALEHRGATHQQFAALASRHRLASIVDHLDLQYLGAAARAGRAGQVILAAHAGADGVGLGHAPADVGQRVAEAGLDLAHLLGCARRAAAAHHQQAAQVVLSGLGHAHQVAGHRRRCHQRGQLQLVDQRGAGLGIPAVHRRHAALGAVTRQIGRVQPRNMEQRHRQQRARLLGRRLRLDAGDQRAHRGVQLPRHQRRDDVAVARRHALGVAGGARGVEHRGQVVGRDGRGGHGHVADRVGQVLQQARALGQLLGPHRQHLQARRGGALGPAVQPFGIGQQDLGATVGQRVGHFLGRPVRVHRHRHRPDRGDGCEGEDPLGVVAHRDRHPVAMLHTAAVHQHLADARRRGPGLGEAVALILVAEKGQLAGGGLEQRTQGRRCVLENPQRSAVDRFVDQFVRLAGGGGDGDGLLAGDRSHVAGLSWRCGGKRWRIAMPGTRLIDP